MLKLEMPWLVYRPARISVNHHGQCLARMRRPASEPGHVPIPLCASVVWLCTRPCSDKVLLACFEGTSGSFRVRSGHSYSWITRAIPNLLTKFWSSTRFGPAALSWFIALQAYMCSFTDCELKWIDYCRQVLYCLSKTLSRALGIHSKVGKPYDSSESPNKYVCPWETRQNPASKQQQQLA